MKLRLPKKFTDALLAACTAFSLNAAAVTTGTAMFSGGTTNYNRGDMLLDMYLTRDLTTGTAMSDTLNLDNAVNIYGGNFFAKDFTISIWVDSAALSNSHLLFAYGNYYDPTHDWQANGLYWDANNKVLTLGDGKVTGGYTTFNFQDSNRKIATTINDMPTSGLVNITLAVHGANIHQEGTVYVNGSATGYYMRTVGGGYYYNGNMNGDSDPIGLYVASGVTYGNITVTDQKLTDQTARYALMGLSSEKPAQSFNYVWNGEAPTAAWNTTSESWLDNGRSARYVSSLDTTANFNTGDVAKDVAVSGDIIAATVNVNDDYTFTVESGSSLTANALNVAADKTATVAGAGTISLGSLSGALAIEAGATVNVTGTITLSGTQSLPVSGEGTLGVTTLQVTGGTHTITNDLNVTGGGDGKGSVHRMQGLAVTNAGATITLEGDTHISGAMYDSVGTVNIGNGTDKVRVTTSRMEFGDTGTATASILNVNANATLHVKGSDVANSYVNTALVLGEREGVSTVNIAGKLYADNATAYVGDSTVTFNIEDGGLLAVKGLSQNVHKEAMTEIINLNLRDGGTLVLGENGIASRKPINVCLEAGEVGISADSVTIAKDVVLSGGATTFNTAKYVWESENDTRELAKGSEGGTLTISGSITGDGTITKTGAGTLVLSGTNNVLTHTIVVNEGTLDLYGTFAIDGNEDDMTVSYSGAAHVGNGFKTASGEIVVYTASNDGNITFGNAAHITYAGVDVKNKLMDGVYTAEEETFYATFYVNSGAENVSQALKATGMKDIVLSDSTTLNLDADIASSRIGITSGTATMNIGSGKTLTGTIQNAVIMGSGTYALNSGTPDLGADTILDENWAGMVRIGGFFASSSTHLDTFVNGNVSTVEIFGITGGYLPEYSGGAVCANIKLSDPDSSTPAWIWSSGGGYSAITFTGDWSGNGTFRKTGNNNQSFAFSGDISEWRGAFEFSSGSSNTTNLTFKGSATEMNAAISKPGAGMLNIIVGDGQSDFDATFRDNVTASNLQVKDNATATLKGETSIGSISGAGALIIDAEGHTVSINGSSGVLGNVIGLQAGSLSLAGTYDLSNLEVVGGTKYEGGEGIADGNGFTIAAGTLHVVNITSGTLTLTSATFNYRGSQVEVDAATGDATLSGGTSYTTLYVNNDGEASYAAAQAIAEQHEADVTSVVLNATGTTITMDAEASVALTMASAAESATVLATEDITLTSVAGPATGKTLTISAIGHTVSIQGDNDFMGNIEVDSGIVVLDSSSNQGKKTLGEFNGNQAKDQPAPAPDKTITINKGGLIDLNGKGDLTYVYTLNGGSLVNNGRNISSGAMQTNGLVLTMDSTIGGTGDFYLLGPDADNTFVTLNNHKLTKTGTNNVGFRNSNVTEGIIEVKQGNIEFIDGDNSSLAADIVMDGGSISGSVRSAGEISITALQETTINGFSLRTGQVDIIGTVNVSGGILDLSNSEASTGIICVTADGELNVNSDIRMHSTAGIDFAEGGAMNIPNLNIVGNVGASIRTTAENQLYDTNNANFTIANVVITATANVSIGNTLVESDVVTGAHAVTLSNAASTYGDITVSEGGRLIANADMTISGTLKLADGSSMQVGNIVNMAAKGNVDEAISGDIRITDAKMYATKDKGALSYVNMTTKGDYTIKDMSISGSLIDVGEGATLYLVNVDIKSDTQITDEAAWLDMKATNGWLDKDNTQVVREYTTEQDTTLFKSGDTGRSITLAAGTEIVELTSDMFDTVTMTGTDLWLDMTGIAEATYNKDYFTLDFQNLAHSLENAQVDVDHLHVYASLDGERYTEAYSTANGGLTTTLYFQVPEPTTSTLSLLALAALAARRRRK